MLNRIQWLVVLALVVATMGCPKSSPCGASTCATGCCDAQGACVTLPTAEACGTQGAQCTSCGAGQQCQLGTCTMGGSTGGGTAGTGGGSGGRTDAWSAYQALAAAACRWQARCGQIESAQISYCTDYYVLQGTSYLFPRAAEQQIRNFDIIGAEECAQAYDATPCTAFSLSCGLSLSSLVGSVSTGAACVGNSGECQSTLDSCVGATCPKTCQSVPQGANGQPCRRVTTGAKCEPGLFCNQDQICEAKRADGASCLNGDDECQSGACENSICAGLPPIGDLCRPLSPRCTLDGYCETSNNVCVASKSEGEACTGYPRECAQGLGCVSRVCRARVGVGERCTNFNSCQENLGCDGVMRTCQVNEYARPLGAQCTGDALRCASPQLCEGARVNPDGGVGTLGICAIPQLGSPCTESYQCPKHAYCDSNHLCAAATVGVPCSSSDGCQAGDYCGSTHTCTPRFATGAQCYIDAQSCLSPSDRCMPSVADATPRCRPLAGAGGTCLNRDGCKPLLECVNQICVETGHQGKPCISGQYCLDGACRGDAGCVAPLPVGEACINYRECASGYCIDGVCRASACP